MTKRQPWYLVPGSDRCRWYLMPGMRCDGQHLHAGNCFKEDV